MHRTNQRRNGFFLLLGMLAVLIACFADVRDKNNTPPQGWWEQRGPVVPHDSFPEDCSLCHAGGDWHVIRADFSFDHAEKTGVELVGEHARAECLRCHNDKGQVAVFAAQGCAGCHEDVHRGGLGRDCSQCHDELSWKSDEAVRGHVGTRFPLVGAHAAATCWRCHLGAETGVFTGLDPTCESCHGDDLAATVNPDHLALGFTSDCDRCHIPTSWAGAGFKHPGFALVGGHAALDCTECHVGGNFSGTPTDCYSCHMPEYAATNDPNHTAAGFSTDCESCHSTSSWFGAVYRHNNWALTGAHIAANCTDCHAGNVFAGTPTDCFSCHMAEYAATTMPPHAASGFSTSCEDCHATTTWFGANFNHSFPITSGAHRVLDCTDCHTTPSNFTVFSCIDCHEHRQSRMDDKHSGVSGYVWQTSACYACHPTGRG